MTFNLNQLMQQAKKMQGVVTKIQEELETKRVEAASGGGMVTVVMNGKQELLEIKIDSEVIDPEDPEMLEDLIIAAVNEGIQRSRELASQEMMKATGGVNIPGLFDMNG